MQIQFNGGIGKPFFVFVDEVVALRSKLLFSDFYFLDLLLKITA